MFRLPPRLVVIRILSLVLVGFCALSPLEARPAKPQREKPSETVRTPAIRDYRAATTRHTRQKTEVERTAAINRKPVTGQEPTIHRRDDQTPSITTPPPVTADANAPEIVVDVRRQRLVLKRGNKEIKSYRVSTSRFGIGDRFHSYKTPVGRFKVDGKIGGNLPMGAVLKQGRFTGEILQPNAPGRDPIVTRMIRLRGMERQNANTYGRGIFIHGTPDEKRIGKPVSWGCIRMRSSDVVDLYARIGDGTQVTILHPEEKTPNTGGSWFARIFSGETKEDPGT